MGDRRHDLLGNSSDDTGTLRFEAASDGDDVSSGNACEVDGDITSLSNDKTDEQAQALEYEEKIVRPGKVVRS